jgi:hypothetical protein
VNFGFVTLLKFYISDGFGAIFLDSPVNSLRKPTAATFRAGFSTHGDFWDVSKSDRCYKCNILILWSKLGVYTYIYSKIKV